MPPATTSGRSARCAGCFAVDFVFADGVAALFAAGERCVLREAVFAGGFESTTARPVATGVRRAGVTAGFFGDDGIACLPDDAAADFADGRLPVAAADPFPVVADFLVADVLVGDLDTADFDALVFVPATFFLAIALDTDFTARFVVDGLLAAVFFTALAADALVAVFNAGFFAAFVDDLDVDFFAAAVVDFAAVFFAAAVFDFAAVFFAAAVGDFVADFFAAFAAPVLLAAVFFDVFAVAMEVLRCRDSSGRTYVATQTHVIDYHALALCCVKPDQHPNAMPSCRTRFLVGTFQSKARHCRCSKTTAPLAVIPANAGIQRACPASRGRQKQDQEGTLERDLRPLLSGCTSAPLTA